MARNKTSQRRGAGVSATAVSPAGAGPAAGLGRSSRQRHVGWAAVLLMAATVAVYFNSLSTPFIFDDLPGIVENTTIRSFSPIWQPLIPPQDGSSAAGRPVLNLSLALNYAWSGLDVRSYHVVNLLIHLAAGLALFGIVRRTLERLPSPGWRHTPERTAAEGERGADASCNLIGYTTPAAVAVAAGVALVWLVHPLQTESVTFIVQRTESLGGLFYLLTLYAFVRATEGSGVIRTEWPRKGPKNQSANEASDAPRGARESRAGQTDLFGAALRRSRLSGRGWFVVSFLSCLIGVATKEILGTAPLILLLYDRTFVAGTFRAAWRARRGFYVSVSLSWLLLGWLMWSAQGRGGTVALGRGVDVWTTLLTQSRAVATYLQLAVWPHPLVIDYGDYVSDAVRHLADVWLQALGLVALLAATVYALIKRPALGFLGAWFFIILGPSSSFIPLLSQTRAEHRMYLPLAAIAVLAVVGVWRLFGRAAFGVVGVLALALGVATVDRNADYRSPLAMWTATVAAQPLNPRAHYNLAVELGEAGDRAGAIRAYEESVRLNPKNLKARVNLTTLLLLEGRAGEARVHAEAAVVLDPASVPARGNLARLRVIEGDLAGAIEELKAAVRLEPDNPDMLNQLAHALAMAGWLEEAAEPLRHSAAVRPAAATWMDLGEVSLALNRLEEARRSFEAAVRLKPDDAMANFHLAEMKAARGDHAGAIPHYEAAIKAEPAAIPPRFNLALALRALGRRDEAIESLKHVLRLDPGDRGAAEMIESLETGRR